MCNCSRSVSNPLVKINSCSCIQLSLIVSLLDISLDRFDNSLQAVGCSLELGSSIVVSILLSGRLQISNNLICIVEILHETSLATEVSNQLLIDVIVLDYVSSLSLQSVNLALDSIYVSIVSSSKDIVRCSIVFSHLRLEGCDSLVYFSNLLSEVLLYIRIILCCLEVILQSLYLCISSSLVSLCRSILVYISCLSISDNILLFSNQLQHISLLSRSLSLVFFDSLVSIRNLLPCSLDLAKSSSVPVSIVTVSCHLIVDFSSSGIEYSKSSLVCSVDICPRSIVAVSLGDIFLQSLYLIVYALCESLSIFLRSYLLCVVSSLGIFIELLNFLAEVLISFFVKLLSIFCCGLPLIVCEILIVSLCYCVSGSSGSISVNIFSSVFNVFAESCDAFAKSLQLLAILTLPEFVIYVSLVATSLYIIDLMSQLRIPQFETCLIVVPCWVVLKCLTFIVDDIRELCLKSKNSRNIIEVELEFELNIRELECTRCNSSSLYGYFCYIVALYCERSIQSIFFTIIYSYDLSIVYDCSMKHIFSRSQSLLD